MKVNKSKSPTLDEKPARPVIPSSMLSNKNIYILFIEKPIASVPPSAKKEMKGELTLAPQFSSDFSGILKISK